MQPVILQKKIEKNAYIFGSKFKLFNGKFKVAMNVEF